MSEADLFRAVAEEDGGMNSVKPGLVPGIHVLKRSRRKEGVDGRVKPGHDEL